MQHYTDTLFDTAGNAISGATVNVYTAGTTTAATIYSDNVGTSTSNPLTTGTDGSFDFYADNGTYDLVITHASYTFSDADTAGLVMLDPIATTWTPTLTFTTAGDLSVSYTTRVGSYVKVGRKVTVWFSLVTSTFTHTTASGSLRITGLPYAAQSNAGFGYEGTMGFQGITKASYTQMNPLVANAASQITFDASGTAQSYSTISSADVPTGGTVKLQGSVTYDAAS